MKLGLGTVQFGMNYGISNKIGQTDAKEVEKILSLAKKNDVRLLDTAPLYGPSEVILGQCMGSDNDFFKVITKTLKFEKEQIEKNDVKKIYETFHQSLDRLLQKKLYALLFHHPNDLMVKGGEYLYTAALELKDLGLIEKIGASVYSPQQADKLFNKYKLDLIQLPVNVFDQRFIHNGYVKQLKRNNVEVHARSVFLQGLLLMEFEEIPDFFSPIKPHITQYYKFLRDKNLNQMEAALGFVLGVAEIDYLICGINNASQFLEILAVQSCLNIDELFKYQLNQEVYLNPSKWNLSQ